MNKPLKARLLNSGVEPPAGLPPINIDNIKDMSAIPPPQPSPTKAPTIMIAIPSGRTWESRTATAVAGLMGYSIQQGLQIGILNLEGSMITKQRNDLVEMAKKQGADYIQYIDSDMMFPPDALVRLLKHGKDVVGATYNKRVPPYETLGMLKGPAPSDAELRRGGLRQADLLPGGFVLVKMSVYDKLTWPYYFESYQWEGKTSGEAFRNMIRNYYSALAPDEIFESFDETPLAKWLDEVWTLESKTRWQYYSEDLSFFRKLAKAGIAAWCDMDLTWEIKHLGTLEVTCVLPPVPSVVVPAVM